MAKVKHAAVDVICTEFVVTKDGYKQIIGEHPMRFDSSIWDVIRKQQYANREFRLAPIPVVQPEITPIEVSKEVEVEYNEPKLPVKRGRKKA